MKITKYGIDIELTPWQQMNDVVQALKQDVYVCLKRHTIFTFPLKRISRKQGRGSNFSKGSHSFTN